MQKLILNYPGPCIFSQTNILYFKEWVFENFDFDTEEIDND